ncbi:MAG: MATE family efflux transporter [Erysipelotrichaceae bacterium]|nr:MATE family efflux transporter [Erysipelotrichaceae bacterium]
MGSLKLVLNRMIEPKKGIEESKKKFSNKALIALIIPIIVEQFLALLVGIADTLMISYAGEAAVSGVSLVNQLNNIFIMIFTALATGGAIIASQYIGSKDQKKGNLAASQLVMLTTLISIVVTVLLMLFGKNVFTLVFGRVEKDVFGTGMTYLYLSAISFPFLAVYNGCAGLYRSMGKTKTLMNISIVTNVINVVGNYIGVFILHAGVAGVAIPSLISRIYAAVVMYILSSNQNNTIFIQLKQVLSFHKEMIIRIFKIAIPNSIENGLFQISKVALSSIVALFGTVQIAANGIAQSFWSMSALFVIAMGPAFMTVIGQYMGAGDPEGADYYMKKLLRMTYIGSFVWNTFFFIITPLLLQLYSLSSEGKQLVIILVFIHNAFNIITCPYSFSLSNGLRAAGDIKFTMYSSIFSTVICRVIFSVILGLWLNMGVIGIALAMGIDWTIKAALIIVRYRSGKWKHFKVID